MPHKIDEETPDTYELEQMLISEGRAYEGYSLRYLRQIRDLLLNSEASSGRSLRHENNKLVEAKKTGEKTS
jgi:hypothetical protein